VVAAARTSAAAAAQLVASPGEHARATARANTHDGYEAQLRDPGWYPPAEGAGGGEVRIT
jgi:hypothetical protein